MASDSFVIQSPPPIAPAQLLDAFEGVVTAHISDNLRRLSGITGLQRFHRSRKLLGTAFTVKTRPGDNLLVYKALMEMSPGHVLVVDGAGDTTNALVGDLLLQYAQQRGCVGFIIDGAIRDSAAFLEADFPCYARGVTHRGPYKQGPGAINVPVSVGGQVVQPGDIVVGDEDGVVTFPVADAARLLEGVQKTVANETAISAEIATGEAHQSWLSRMLSAHGLL